MPLTMQCGVRVRFTGREMIFPVHKGCGSLPFLSFLHKFGYFTQNSQRDGSQNVSGLFLLAKASPRTNNASARIPVEPNAHFQRFWRGWNRAHPPVASVVQANVSNTREDPQESKHALTLGLGIAFCVCTDRPALVALETEGTRFAIPSDARFECPMLEHGDGKSLWEKVVGCTRKRLVHRNGSHGSHNTHGARSAWQRQQIFQANANLTKPQIRPLGRRPQQGRCHAVFFRCRTCANPPVLPLFLRIIGCNKTTRAKCMRNRINLPTRRSHPSCWMSSTNTKSAEVLLAIALASAHKQDPSKRVVAGMSVGGPGFTSVSFLDWKGGYFPEGTFILKYEDGHVTVNGTTMAVQEIVDTFAVAREGTPKTTTTAKRTRRPPAAAVSKSRKTTKK